MSECLYIRNFETRVSKQSKSLDFKEQTFLFLSVFNQLI